MKFLSKVWQFITLVFSFLSAPFTDYVLPALKITEALKTLVENPSLDILTHATNSKWDEEFLKTVRTLLAKVIESLKIIPDPKEIESEDELIRHLIDFLRELEPEQRNAFYHKIASILTQYLSPEEIKEYEADTLVQLAYTREKVNNQ